MNTRTVAICDGGKVSCMLQIVQTDFVKHPACVPRAIFPKVKQPGCEALTLTYLMSIKLGAVQ